MEESKEATQPAEYTDCRELHDTFEDCSKVQLQKLVQRVLQKRCCVLCASDPYNDTEPKHLQQASKHEAPTNVRGAWVDGLVNECGCPPEVAHVLEVDVFRIWARFVELRQWLGLSGMQIRMSQVTVGEGVGRTLEKDDDSMHLAEGADAWVVDVVVDILGCNIQVRDGIDAVEEGNGVPG